MADGRMQPPGPTHRRRHRDHDIGATAPLHRPPPALHDRRHRPPCKTRFRLAGCAFAGRASNPLGRCERFQSVPHLLSNFIPRSGAYLTQARRMRDGEFWAHRRRVRGGAGVPAGVSRARGGWRLSEDSAVARMLEDYAVMRAQGWSCACE